MPCLALRGVAKGIAKSHSLKAKVLLRESRDSCVLLTLFVETVDSELQERPRDGRLYSGGLYQVRF